MLMMFYSSSKSHIEPTLPLIPFNLFHNRTHPISSPNTVRRAPPAASTATTSDLRSASQKRKVRKSFCITMKDLGCFSGAPLTYRANKTKKKSQEKEIKPNRNIFLHVPFSSFLFLDVKKYFGNVFGCKIIDSIFQKQHLKKIIYRK